MNKSVTMGLFILALALAMSVGEVANGLHHIANSIGDLNKSVCK